MVVQTLPAALPARQAVAMGQSETARPYPAAADPALLSQADAEFVFDTRARAVLANNNATQPLPLASLTKLMTVLTTLKTYRLDDVLVVPDAVTALPEAKMGLASGDQLMVKDLLAGVLIPSANDAAETLAAGQTAANPAGQNKRAAFIAAMNRNAMILGLTSLHYADPAGLDPTTVGSAQDTARLLEIVARNATVQKLMNTERLTVHNQGGQKSYKLVSTNLLFSKSPLPGFIGGKTGYINEAGFNLAAMTKEVDGRTLITVVLHARGNTKQAAADTVSALTAAIRAKVNPLK